MKKQPLWKKVVGVSVMTSAVAYGVSGGFRTITEYTKLVDNLIDFKGTMDFILNTGYEHQLATFSISALFMGFMISKLGGNRGYSVDDSHGVHGTSRWGDVDELKEGNAISTKNKVGMGKPFKTLKVDDGIVLGKIPEKDEILIMPVTTTVDNSNVFMIGASGSGKGQAFVYNNIVNNSKKTMIITDPKGELYHATHQIKRDQGFDVFQIDFLNLDQAKYNPLDYVVKDIDAKKISEAIAKNSAKDGKEDFFFTTARDLLTGLIIYCKTENPNASIPIDVKNQFYKVSEDENYLLELCENIGRNHPAYAYLKDASVADGKTRTSILSSFAQQTAIFSLKDVEKMTMSSDFNFHDFQDRKSILYVKIPMKSNPVEALTATFFDQLISVLYDIADKKHGVLPIKTMFLLDEFANLGKINDYEGTLSTCRGLGMEMITIVQDLAQLENKYGKEIGRTIVNNHDTKLFLRTGDVETAKYFSGLAGETTARMKTVSNSQSGGIFTNGSNSKSTQEQYVKRPLITEGELMKGDKNTCYLFVSGYYPLKLEKAWQYEIYGDFLFNKDRQPNYLTYRDRYLKFLGKEVTPLEPNKELNSIENFEKESDEQPVKIHSDEKLEEKEDIIITKTKVSEPILPKESEEVVKADEKFNQFAQDFLKNGFNIDNGQQLEEVIVEQPEQPVVVEEIYEELIELDAKKEFLEVFSNSNVVTEELLNEEEVAIAEVNEYINVLDNLDDTTKDFMKFAEENTQIEKHEDEAILIGD